MEGQMEEKREGSKKWKVRKEREGKENRREN